MNLLQEKIVDSLKIRVYGDRSDMGQAAGKDVAEHLRTLLSRQDNVRMVFAAAPSQNEMLARLAAEEGIDWNRVTVFHMDEYVGLPAGAPQHFSSYLMERLFEQVRPGEVNLINSQNDTVAECQRYAARLQEAPIDIVCLGIGENGHIAFNDPPVADFEDPETVKLVELDEACRQQQVNDECFPTMGEVPTHAITLTIPALMSGRRLFCSVPGKSKREAISQVLSLPVTEQCPATILRRHSDCILYTDADAYRAV